MKVNVYNLIILDESGSMQSIHKPAVDGLNETLQSIQSAQETYKDSQKHLVTMVFFNSNGIRTIIENQPIAQVRTLHTRDFCPSACTPLYDAMGASLSKLRYQLNENEENHVLVTIITDGYENASREYSGDMIKNLIRDLKKEGWTFAYIGANQNVEEVASSMSIDNHLLFHADDEGSKAMSEKLKKSRIRFYCKLSEKADNLQSDFFQ